MQPRRSSPEDLRQKIHLDNLFRLALSLATFALVSFLWTQHLFPHLHPLFCLLIGYSCGYMLIWALLPHTTFLRPLDFLLTAFDIGGITTCIHYTGGAQSPLFYLYALPFLVQAFHFDLNKIRWSGILSIVAYGVLFDLHHKQLTSGNVAGFAGQLLFLGVVVVTAVVTVRLLRRKDIALQKSVLAVASNVDFLNELNAVTLELPLVKLQEQIALRLNQILKPFETYARLWVYEEGWKTLRGVGEHPALRPGSPAYLPVRACPAFALRKPFRYDQNHGEPCSSEQFNYTSHLCLPVASEKDVFGVLFLGTYAAKSWDREDVRFFETLAHSIALTLQRKALFERLQEKITELNFSFEVGVAALNTFVGSTQSIDETTVHILDSVLAILKVDRASLMLWSAPSMRLQTQWVRGTDFRIHSAMGLGMGEGMAGWALKLGEPYWAEYAMSDPHYMPSAQPIKSLLCVPVFTVDHKPLGVINAVTVQEPRAFTEREINFLKSFGQQAALAIENAQLHHKNRSHIEQLKELDKMKSQFLSLVSHDLRGPLTGVRGYCEILKQQNPGPLTPSQMDIVVQLERQVELQERMVDDLLDFARMEKGRLSIHPAACDLAQLLKEEVEKSQIEARERQIELSLSLPSSPLPQLILDEGRIRQVVWNLIHNALKFTPEEGRVVVRAAIPMLSENDPNTLLIEVSDTGIGLSPETQDRIFDKFFQITPGGSKGSQGLGLGLAICKEIVLAHRGKIRAQSPGLGQGTTITFDLPIPVAAAAPASHPASKAA
jgi:signal transduction histidine kinase